MCYYLGLLKGAVPFMADISRALSIPVQQDWMAVSSYGSGTVSSGVVRILKDLDADINGPTRFDCRGHHRLRTDPFLAHL